MATATSTDRFMDTELLTAPQAAAFLQMHPISLSSWRMKRKGPPYLKIGGKVRYPKHLLIKWANESLVVPENERVA